MNSSAKLPEWIQCPYRVCTDATAAESLIALESQNDVHVEKSEAIEMLSIQVKLVPSSPRLLRRESWQLYHWCKDGMMQTPIHVLDCRFR